MIQKLTHNIISLQLVHFKCLTTDFSIKHALITDWISIRENKKLVCIKIKLVNLNQAGVLLIIIIKSVVFSYYCMTDNK